MKINEKLLADYDNVTLYHYAKNPPIPNAHPYDELGVRDITGVLKMAVYRDGRLIQTYSEKENHVGVIAATRLGKTSSYVIPTVISYARQKNKRSMIISDPKGELYRETSRTLRDEGYEVKLLNFRDHRHSECWNPLTKIFRKYRRAMSVFDEVGVDDDEENPHNVFMGKTYEDQVRLDEDVEREIRMRLDEVGGEIDEISQMFVATHNTRDPYWEDSARDVLKAFLWAMLEDSNPSLENHITEDTYSFSTILTIIASFRDGDELKYNDGGYFTNRPEDSRAYALAKNTLIENGKPTRKCIMSSLSARIAIFNDVAMRLITSCNTFEMSELTGDKPIAIYVNYRDELKVHYQVISLFIQNAYAYLIDYANSQPQGKLDVPFYFILDEFGNFPEIKDFDTVISACGGRNVFFMLILQSYAQLNNVYGDSVAEVIRDNLNVHVFFGSNNPRTLEEFSKECGNITRISPISALIGKDEKIDDHRIETIEVMPRSRLSSLGAGECIVTEANCGYVIFSKMERYYLCKEFSDLPKADTKEYDCPVDTSDKKYSYEYRPKGRGQRNRYGT